MKVEQRRFYGGQPVALHRIDGAVIVGVGATIRTPYKSVINEVQFSGPPTLPKPSIWSNIALWFRTLVA